MERLADVIKEKGYNPHTWMEEKSFILLKAPTGCGKTWFTIRVLGKICWEHGRKMAIIVNRNALRAQVEREVVKFELENDVIRKVIYVFTYQELNQEWGRKKFNGAYFSFVVCDEAHYFCSDSLFSNVETSFKFLLSQRGKSCLIMMTATPDELEPLLRRGVKMKLWKDNNASHENFFDMKADLGSLASGEGNRFDFWALEEYPLYEINEIEEDYSYVDVAVCRKDKIVETVTELPVYDKCLIFVNTKKEGKKLRKRIEKNLKAKNDRRTVAFVHSGYEDNAEMKEVVGNIIKTEKLPVSILICTSVLDNGITITDHKLKHIFVFPVHKAEMKQMLGRKRVQERERVTLYLIEEAVAIIKKQWQHLTDVCGEIYSCLEYGSNDLEKAIIKSKLLKAVRERFVIQDDNDNLELSRISLYMHSKIFNELQEIINEIENGGSYECLVCQWIDRNPEEIRYLRLTDEAKSEILNMWEGMELVIESETFASFAKKLGATNDIKAVNTCMSKLSELQNCMFSSERIDKKTYYFRETNDMFPYKLKTKISSKEELQEIISKHKQETGAVFLELFGTNIPECVRDCAAQFLSLCLRNQDGIKKVSFRESDGMLQIYGGVVFEEKKD